MCIVFVQSCKLYLQIELNRQKYMIPIAMELQSASDGERKTIPGTHCHIRLEMWQLIIQCITYQAVAKPPGGIPGGGIPGGIPGGLKEFLY